MFDSEFEQFFLVLLIEGWLILAVFVWISIAVFLREVLTGFGLLIVLVFESGSFDSDWVVLEEPEDAEFMKALKQVKIF